MNVPGCSNIEIHRGNTESDSEGCVLVGLARSGDTIIYSEKAFDALMSYLDGIDNFALCVQ